MIKASILLVLLSFTLNDIFATQRLFISPTGNDKNNGTKEQPLASLDGALDRVSQLREQGMLDDTVFVQVLPGSYYMKEPLRLGPNDGGTAQSPVIFTADADNRPVFYGGMKLGKFEEVNKNLWRVFVPEVAHYGFCFEQLFVNGERRVRARTPNRGDFYMVRRMEEIPIDKQGEQRWADFASQKIILHPSDASVLDKLQADNADDILAVFHHSWSPTRQFIRYVNPADTAFYITGSGLKPWNPINYKTRFYIENFREALDAPGEWFLSRNGYLYYIPLPGETIANTECIVPIIDKFIVISGDEKTGKRVENIEFENLCFRVSGYKTPPGGTPANQAASIIDACVNIDYARNIGFINCEFTNTGLYVMWFRRACSECLVNHCEFRDMGTGGIKIGEMRSHPDSTLLTRHITIDNNIIQHGGYIFPDAVGVVVFRSSDNTITHNDIADFRYSGVSAGWSWGYGASPSKRNKIEFNHIHHLGWGELSDMGGVYTLGKSEGTTISNNVIHHVFSFDYGGWGLYTDEGSSDIVMENNLVYCCSNAGYMHHYGKDNIIRNNIFAFNIEAQVQFGRGEEHRMYTFLRNIVYFNKGSAVNSTWHSKNGLKAVTTEFDYNCYRDTRSLHPDFHGLDFKSWQELGKDRHSIIADPLFVDPENFDFRFRRLTVARKIGFKPFDYSKAGVYGDPEWKNKARLPEQMMEAFDKAVVKNAWRGIYGWYESTQK